MDARAKVRQILAEANQPQHIGNVVVLHPPPRKRPLPRLAATALVTLALILPGAAVHHATMPTPSPAIATNDCTDYQPTTPAKVSQNPDPYFRAMEMLGIQNPCNRTTTNPQIGQLL